MSTKDTPDIQKKLNAAHNAGYDNGYKDGKIRGYEAGYEDGYADGKSERIGVMDVLELAGMRPRE